MMSRQEIQDAIETDKELIDSWNKRLAESIEKKHPQTVIKEKERIIKDLVTSLIALRIVEELPDIKGDFSELNYHIIASGEIIKEILNKIISIEDKYPKDWNKTRRP